MLTRSRIRVILLLVVVSSTLMVPLARAAPAEPVGHLSEETSQSAVLESDLGANQVDDGNASDGDDEGGGGGIGIPSMFDFLVGGLLDTFQGLANLIMGLLVSLMVEYPDVTSDDVLSVHNDVFRLSMLVSVAGVAFLGVLTITGVIQGIRPVGHLLMALGIGAVAPWLLGYAVELSALMTRALLPAEPGFWTTIGVTSNLLIVVVLNSMFALALAVIFVIRNVYLPFVAAAAPLLALGYVIPPTRRLVAPLLGVFAAFLLIGPLNIIVLRLVIAFLEVDAYEIPNWLGAMGGLVLMLGIAYIVLNSGMAAVGAGLSYARGASVSGRGQQNHRQEHPQDDWNERSQSRSSSSRMSNRFSGGGRYE